MVSRLQLIILTLALLTGTCLAATIGNGSVDYNNSNEHYDKVFAAVLRELDSLELHVSILQDYEHDFVRFLLQQRHCALRLSLSMSSGQPVAAASREKRASRHHFWLYANVEQMLQGLSSLINYGGVYILALQQAPSLDSEILQFMAALWQRQGHNRVYYVLSSGRSLLYDPFQQRLLPVSVDAYERIYRNLQGHPLRTYIFDSVYSSVYGDAETRRVLQAAGADAKLAQILANKLNFSLDYQWPDDEFFGSQLENGSYSGALGRVIRRELDLVVSGFFIKDYLTRRIEFTAAVYTDELCLYVQKAKRIPQSILPLFAVHLDVWLCFLLVGFACAAVWLCIRGMNLGLGIERVAGSSSERARMLSRYSIAGRIFLDTWVAWVRVNVGQFPPFHSERIFLASLCLVSVIFGALLESSLATVYIRPLYYKDLNTLDELDAAQLPIYIKHPAFKDDLFVGHDSPVYQRLNARMLLVGEGEDRLIAIVAKRGGFAGVTRAASLMQGDIRYIMTNRVHKVFECPKSYHIAYLLQRHSPYLDAINVLVLQISAAGLIDLWTGEMKERAKWSIHKYPDYLAMLGVGKWKVLTLPDIQLAFYALLTGCLLATLVLSLELLWPRLLIMYFKKEKVRQCK